MSRHRQQWLLAGVVGLAFALRVVGLDLQSLWRDEVDAIRFAQFPVPELLQLFVQPGHNGPLYYWILRPWLARRASHHRRPPASRRPSTPILKRRSTREFPDT